MTDSPHIPGFDCAELLGEGAFGKVYLAQERDGLRRPVALKVFFPAHRAAYQRELEVLRRVEELRRRERLEGIVQSLGSGEAGGHGWIALEYLEDGSLADHVAREGPLPCERAVGYVTQAAQAVAALHAAGLFHRDVKPANLLLGADGRVRLGDFGLSRDLDGTLSAAGSPAFAAPEVIAGQATDGRRIDVYALGATLAFLLTGEAMRPGRPDLFALDRARVPRDLQEVIAAATAYEPDERTADAAAFVEALQRVTKGARTISGGLDGSGVGSVAPRPEPLEEPAVKDKPAAPATPLDVADLPIDAKHPRCPYCHDPVRPGAVEAKRSCSACMAWHHAACWEDHGGCAACEAVEDGALPQAEPRAPRRTSRLAIASLVCALLVFPTLIVMGGLTLVQSGGSSVRWSDRVERQPDGTREYYLDYERDGERGTVGPSPSPLGRADIPERSVSVGARVLQVALIALLLAPFGLEVAAFTCGVRARRRIDASGGALTGRGFATAGLVVAGLNLVGPCLMVPAGALVWTRARSAAAMEAEIARSHMEEARAAEAEARTRPDLQALGQAVLLFRASANRYPTTDEGLAALLERPAGVADWNGPYLDGRSVPRDPWGTPYRYELGRGGVARVISCGPDRNPGTGDDIVEHLVPVNAPR